MQIAGRCSGPAVVVDDIGPGAEAADRSRLVRADKGLEVDNNVDVAQQPFQGDLVAIEHLDSDM